MNKTNKRDYESKSLDSNQSKKIKKFNFKLSNLSSVRQILLWYIIISLSGALLLWMPFSHNEGQSVSFIDALFVSSSAFSDTGLSPIGISDTFNFFGQFVTLILLQIGGVGWFTIKIFLITFILKRRTNYNTIADGSSELGTTTKNDTLGLIFCAIIISISASLIMGFVFSFIFFFTNVEGVDGYFNALWMGIYHASASINNAGLDIFAGNDSMATLYGDQAGMKVGWEITIEILTMFLFILGGIGFGIAYDLYKYFKSRTSGESFSFSIITKISVVTYFSVAAIGLGLTYFSEGMAILGNSQDAFLSSDWSGTNSSLLVSVNEEKLYNELLNWYPNHSTTFIEYLNSNNESINNFISINSDAPYSETTVGFRWWTITFNTFSTRNAGFSTMNLSDLQDSTKLIYSVLMFIGSGPGSTAGGLRTTTFAVIIISLWSGMRNKPQASVFGKAIPIEITRQAFAILCFSLMLVFTDTLIISITEAATGNSSNTLINNMFLVFSAYGTTGLAINDLGTYHWVSKLVLILLMFIGQMGISNTLSQLKTKQIKHQKKYVEEHINLG